MRRFLFFSIALGLAAGAACGPPPPAPPDLITIKGQVVAGGVGVPNAVVYGFDLTSDAGLDASAAPISALTDGTGHFAFYGYGSTYDVMVSPPGSPLDLTWVGGLTGRDPAIALPLPAGAPLHKSHLAVIWNPLPPAGATVAYFLSGPTYPGTELADVAPVSANLADGLTARWRGGFSTTANVDTLVFMTDGSGVPTSYVGAASAYGWLEDGGTMQITFSLQAMKTSPNDLQFTVPDGYSVETADCGFDFGTGSTFVKLLHFDAPPSPTTFDLPDMPGNRINCRGRATHNGESSTSFALGNATPDQTANLGMQFFAASVLQSPDDAATSVGLDTPFSFDGAGIHDVMLVPDDGSRPRIRMITRDSAVTLAPVFALAGLSAPTGAHYTWSATRWPDFPSTDAFNNATTDLSTAKSTTSETRSFTFATP